MFFESSQCWCFLILDGSSFQSRRAATLNARSPNLSLVCGTTRSPLEADRNMVCRSSQETGCTCHWCMSGRYQWLTDTPVCRVWTQFMPQLVANVGRSVLQWRDLVVEDRAPDKQQNLTRAAMVQSLTLAVQPLQHCNSSTARWQMQRRVLQQHHFQVNDESVVDVECGRSMSVLSWQCEQTCSTHSQTAP